MGRMQQPGGCNGASPRKPPLIPCHQHGCITGIKSCFCPHVPSALMTSYKRETRKWLQSVLYLLPQKCVLKPFAFEKNVTVMIFSLREFIYCFSSFLLSSLPPLSLRSLLFPCLPFHQFLESRDSGF